MDKLRWATLGYHHDWDTKVYSENNRGEFPSDLASLSAGIVKALGGDQQYRAEAAIINYYPVNSSLSGTLWPLSVCESLTSLPPGHTDHSEVNLEAPLVSISLGLPAIFLIGGPSLDTVPCPLLLRWPGWWLIWHVTRLCPGQAMCWWWSARRGCVTTQCPGSCPVRPSWQTQTQRRLLMTSL